MPRLVIAINSLSYFRLHRAALARRAAREGWSVDVLAGVDGAHAVAEPDDPFTLHALPLRRDALHPRTDVAFARRLASLGDGADAVHLFTIKPVLAGLTALRRTDGGGPRVVATHPGLGRVFDPPRAGIAARARASIVSALLRRGYDNPRAVATFENEADRAALVAQGVVRPERSVAMPGAGLDLEAYPFAPRKREPGEPLRVLFASRLLARKGLDRVLDAARASVERGHPLSFTIAGWADDGDEDAVPIQEIRAVDEAGATTFAGRVQDMGELIRRHDVLLAPSRMREGFPRVVLEAAASGSTLVVSRSSATAALVEEGETALTLDLNCGADAILAALLRLEHDHALRARLAANARARLVRGGFDARDVEKRFLELYRGSPADTD